MTEIENYGYELIKLIKLEAYIFLWLPSQKIPPFPFWNIWVGILIVSDWF